MATQMDEKIIVPPADGKPSNAGVSTNVANPSRTSWISFVKSLFAFLVVLNIALPVIAQVLQSYPDAATVFGPLYLPILGGLNFAVLVGAFFTKLISRLLAIPAVAEWTRLHASWLYPIKQIK
jgi:hypothetical protein